MRIFFAPPSWRMDFVGPTGKRHRITAFPTRELTARLADAVRQLLDAHALGITPSRSSMTTTETLPPRLKRKLAKIGLLTSPAKGKDQRIKPLVKRWCQSLRNRGCNPNHADNAQRAVLAMFDAIGPQHLLDIRPEQVEQYLADKRSLDGTLDPHTYHLIRFGISTSNHQTNHIKAFYNWLIRERIIDASPIATLRRLNADTDRRIVRRALSNDELSALLAKTKTGKRRSSMSGKQRATLYRLATETGLRSSEIRSLKPASFDLDGQPPTVTVAAAYSKRRRADTLPLRPEFVSELRRYLDRLRPDQPAFTMPPRTGVAKMLRADLKVAGIDYRDSGGRVVDFHALRHTFITNLARGGVHPKLTQQLARHSTIDLTMNVYTHLSLNDTAAALSALPDVSGRPRRSVQKYALDYSDAPLPDVSATHKPPTAPQVNLEREIA